MPTFPNDTACFLSAIGEEVVALCVGIARKMAARGLLELAEVAVSGQSQKELLYVLFVHVSTANKSRIEEQFSSDRRLLDTPVNKEKTGLH